MKAVSATLPWVRGLAREMEAKLDANRHKGDRNGWRREQVSFLRRRLLEEVAELFHEMDTKGVPGIPDERKARKARIRSECADVANFAMMIADVAGGLAPDTEGK